MFSSTWHRTYAGGSGNNFVNKDWESCAKAISTALHPFMTQLIKLLNSIATSTTSMSGDGVSPLSDMYCCVERVLSLPAVDFALDGSDSLTTIVNNDLKWVNDEEQFKTRWNGNGRVLREQLPEIRKAIMRWQRNVVNQWEATGYRHDDAGAACLIGQLPIRLHIDGDFLADALDSADLACIMLHPARLHAATISQAITAAGTYQLSVNR